MSRFPFLRLRRLRRYPFIRRLTAQTHLSVRDLIWPVFIHNKQESVLVPSMPGVRRLCLDDLWRAGEQALQWGVPILALFPFISEDEKDAQAAAATNAQGIVPIAVQGLKKRFPELGVMTDIALDPYTDHGHDGVLDEDGHVHNDRTVAILCQQALIQAQAGADVLAPSDMMDGRIGTIRQTLEKAGCHNTIIVSYAAKYASALYAPFRNAIGARLDAGSDKLSYQMNPTNAREALREIAMDMDEGADMLIIKPALPYLDVIRIAADNVDVPLIAYQVSGEYSMLCAAANAGYLDLKSAMIETLLSVKRAGATAIVTYFVPQLVGELESSFR